MCSAEENSILVHKSFSTQKDIVVDQILILVYVAAHVD